VGHRWGLRANARIQFPRLGKRRCLCHCPRNLSLMVLSLRTETKTLCEGLASRVLREEIRTQTAISERVTGMNQQNPCLVEWMIVVEVGEENTGSTLSSEYIL